jgi:HTH-type transcriptional regulator / antitoxin HigA
MMDKLTYKIIKSETQYNEYCQKLEELLGDNSKQDEIELLTLLVEKWDQEHSTLKENDPIELLKYLMAQKKIKSKDLVEVLGVSKGLVSDILNRKKGMSKEAIRLLSNYFNVTQEAFNRPYPIVRDAIPQGKKSSPQSNVKSKATIH